MARYNGLHSALHALLLGCVTLAVVILGFISPLANADDGLSTIESISIDSSSGEITLQTDKPLENYEPFASLKLMNPFRMVVDLPNTTLAGKARDLLGGQPAKTISIGKNNVQEMQIQQTQGMFYQSVRFVIVAQDYDTLNRLKLDIDGRTIKVRQDASATPAQPVASSASSPSEAAPQANTDTIQSSTAKVTLARFQNGQLLLASDPAHQPLQLSNKFTLNQPNRLVMDFYPAALATKSLAGTITVGSDPNTQAIRIGQFDEQTVRVVIETNTPERFRAHFSQPPFHEQNPSHVIISADNSITPGQLPQPTQLTVLEKIGLDKGSHEETLLRLKTREPIVHRWYKTGNQLIVQMLNVAAAPGSVGFDAQKFTHIQSMKVEPLAANQPNSQFVITLTNPDLLVEARMESHDHILALRIQQPQQQPNTSARVNGKKLVVVDAGHGGKDRGTSREGVYEKDLNLSVALKLKAALEARGVVVRMTRDVDKFLALSQITAITNGFQPDAFVSVHHNASTNPAINGIETYYYHSRSIPLAQKVHSRMIATQGRPNRNVRRARFYVINHTNVPAILCEIGYVSNTQERAVLADPRTQSSAANAIADGVVQFLNSR